MTTPLMVTIEVYRPQDCVTGKGGLPHRPRDGARPIYRTESDACFQLEYILEDLGLLACRLYPDLAGKTLAAELTWSEIIDGLRFPEVAVSLPDGRSIRRRYPQAALRADVPLTRPAAGEPSFTETQGDRPLCYLASPASGDEATAAGGDDEFGFEDDDVPALPVAVPVWPAFEHVLALGDLPNLASEHALDSDLPVLVPRSLLTSLARAVGAIPADQFVEVGAFLVGRIVRNGPQGDLMLVVERALLAQHTVSTAASLVFTEASHNALEEQLDQFNRENPDDPLGPRRLLGWVHPHDLGAIASADGQAEDVPDDTERGTSDGRFFSLLDRAVHREVYAAASLAVVACAQACREIPDDLERCFAVYATIDAVVRRRGLYVLEDPEEE